MNISKLSVPRDCHQATLLDFLAKTLQLSKNKTKALLDTRNVLVNGRRVWMAHHSLKPADIIEFPASSQSDDSTPAPQRIPLLIPILHQDKHCIIADKPAGLPTNEHNSLESRLQIQLAIPSLRAIHRLDTDTSGCVLFAVNDSVFQQAVELFAQGQVRKSYSAIVAGRFQPGDTLINKPLDGLIAVTRVRTVCAKSDASYLHIAIDTGRTHQIRRHLTALGHPLLGDRQYGLKRLAESPRFARIPRQMLHAFAISLPHPVSGAKLSAKAPLPPDFKRTLDIFHLAHPQAARFPREA